MEEYFTNYLNKQDKVVNGLIWRGWENLTKIIPVLADLKNLTVFH